MTESSITLKPGEHLDQLGYHGLRIIQNPEKFKFTIDAFLLAGFVNPKPTDKLLDLGTGGGVLSLLLAGQDGLSRVDGVEIQPELAEMARRSVLLNKLEDKITIFEADLRKLDGFFSPNSFDFIVSNPPYFPKGKGIKPDNSALAAAKFELHGTLAEWVRAAANFIRGNGRVAVIYPTERLTELLFAFDQHHLTPKRMCLVHSKPALDSNLVLVEARPGAKHGLQVLPPLFIYSQNNEYTELMNQIFHGKKI